MKDATGATRRFSSSGAASTTVGATSTRPSVQLRPPGWATHQSGQEREDAERMLDVAARGDQLTDEGELASGGYAVVHRAFDRNLLRDVAMKVLGERHAARPVSRMRFIEEAQITGQLDHPNIVPVHEVGLTRDGRYFFTMKLVQGQTLTSLVEQTDLVLEGQQALFRLLQTFLRVCEAVDFAHSKGVIHRDIKPDNIMVGSHGQVYVMDWGIAHLLEGDRPSEQETRVKVRGPSLDAPGLIIGTPAYMAPEQAQGRTEDVDERTDVFSLGAILYFMLTDRPPYRGRDVQGTLKQAQKGKPKPPQVVARQRTLPAGLCRIVMKALSTRREDRYQSVDALRADVERFLRGGAWFAERSFTPGQVIVREGDEADAAYIITSGTCEAYRERGGKRTVLRRMGKGHVFGETAIFTQKPRSASVRAVGRVTAMVVTRESLEQELGMDSWMGHFVRALADRFVELDASVVRPRAQPARRASSRRASKT